MKNYFDKGKRKVLFTEELDYLISKDTGIDRYDVMFVRKKIIAALEKVMRESMACAIRMPFLGNFYLQHSAIRPKQRETKEEDRYTKLSERNKVLRDFEESKSYTTSHFIPSYENSMLKDISWEYLEWYQNKFFDDETNSKT